MFKHLLIPLDGSAFAEAALHTALQLATEHTKLTLVCAVDVPDYRVYNFDMAAVSVPLYQATQEEMLQQAQEYIARVIRDLSIDVQRVKRVVQVGLPSEVILDTALLVHPDAIVMATHGRSGLSRLIFGSVTQAVLHGTTIPVVVVPAHIKQKA
jgi:nucleotide-binding universal stress UspA family protein